MDSTISGNVYSTHLLESFLLFHSSLIYISFFYVLLFSATFVISNPK